MNAESQREFVDANVLVYAFDSSAGQKQEAAQALLERLWHSNTGCVSLQVLQEFFVTITKKVATPLPVDEATARIRDFAAWRVFAPAANDVWLPSTRTARHRSDSGTLSSDLGSRAFTWIDEDPPGMPAPRMVSCTVRLEDSLCCSSRTSRIERVSLVSPRLVTA